MSSSTSNRSAEVGLGGASLVVSKGAGVFFVLLLMTSTTVRFLLEPRQEQIGSIDALPRPESQRIDDASRVHCFVLLAFHSYPQYTFGFAASWEPFAYDSSSGGPDSSACRRYILCSIVSRSCAVIERSAHIHKRCRAHFAEELSGLPPARRGWSVFHAHV